MAATSRPVVLCSISAAVQRIRSSSEALAQGLAVLARHDVAATRDEHKLQNCSKRSVFLR